VTLCELNVFKVEEVAMQQLLEAYDAGNNADETISVERSAKFKIAEPAWSAVSQSPPRFSF